MLGEKRFGFEMTWGFGNDRFAPATAIFYDGKCHKIGRVRLEKSAGLWRFVSEDGRLDLTLTPAAQHTAGTLVAGLIGHRSEQTYGNFNGYVILDDGKRLEVKDLFAFAEKVRNGW